MKRILIATLNIVMALASYSQLPEDALRMSWTNPNGTARQMAVGGAITALGGEITSGFVNPAGLGFFKTSEFVLSPGFNRLGSKSMFRESASKADPKSLFNFGTSGFVFGFRGQNQKWSGKAIGIAINKIASFNNDIHYQGNNNYSSFAEPLANEFANSGLSIDDALNSNQVSLLTKMALYTYLVDTATIGGSTRVIARSEQADLLRQENTITQRGGITEAALSYAANMDDRLYLGISVGIPFVNYTRNTQWKEEDATGKGNNEFAYANYTEKYTSKGAGFNLKVGMILKPASFLRLGFAIHTPTLYTLTEKVDGELTTDIDTARGTTKVFTVKTADLYNNVPQYEYDLTSPWRLLMGVAMVINEVADVQQQKGFITADVEYVGYGGPRFSPTSAAINQNPYKEQNAVIKSNYKGAFNFRAGGELKFNVAMVRLGVAVIGNPYRDPELKANRLNLSGGLGYRNKGFFADLTYTHCFQKNVHFPYRVDFPRLNTFATLKDNISNLMFTVGVKF